MDIKCSKIPAFLALGWMILHSTRNVYNIHDCLNLVVTYGELAYGSLGEVPPERICRMERLYEELNMKVKMYSRMLKADILEAVGVDDEDVKKMEVRDFIRWSDDHVKFLGDSGLFQTSDVLVKISLLKQLKEKIWKLEKIGARVAYEKRHYHEHKLYMAELAARYEELDSEENRLSVRNFLLPFIIILLLERRFKKLAFAVHAAKCFITVPPPFLGAPIFHFDRDISAMPHFLELAMDLAFCLSLNMSSYQSKRIKKAKNDFDERFLVSCQMPVQKWMTRAKKMLLAKKKNLNQLVTSSFTRSFTSDENNNVETSQLKPKKCDNPQKSFFDCCANGDKVLARELLKEFATRIDINATDTDGNTGLHIACSFGHLNLVQSLVAIKKKTINVNTKNNNGAYPMALAALGGHRLVVEKLIQSRKPKVNEEQVGLAVQMAVERDEMKLANLIMVKYSEREGKDFNTTLASYLTRYFACMQTNNNKKIYRKAIMDWFKSKNVSKDVERRKTMEELLQDIKESYLECNICNEEFQNGEVYSCENDHWLCRDCKSALRKPRCPTCRSDFGKRGPERRRMAEQLLADVDALRQILTKQDQCIPARSNSSNIFELLNLNWLKSSQNATKEKTKRSKEDLLRDIQEFFQECNICNEEFCHGEVYSCENDHWICGYCKLLQVARKHSCPTCRADFCPSRRITVEKLLADIKELRQHL